MTTTGDRHPAATKQALARWLPAQRWFAGGGRPVTELSVNGDDEPTLWHLIDAVNLGTWTDRYQILVCLRTGLSAEGGTGWGPGAR
jgi:maltokinase